MIGRLVRRSLYDPLTDSLANDYFSGESVRETPDLDADDKKGICLPEDIEANPTIILNKSTADYRY